MGIKQEIEEIEQEVTEEREDAFDCISWFRYQTKSLIGGFLMAASSNIYRPLTLAY